VFDLSSLSSKTCLRKQVLNSDLTPLPNRQTKALGLYREPPFTCTLATKDHLEYHCTSTSKEGAWCPILSESTDTFEYL